MDVLYRIKRAMSFDQARLLQAAGMVCKVHKIGYILIDLPDGPPGVVTCLKMIHPWHGKNGVPLAGWVHHVSLGRDCALNFEEARRWSLWALWTELHKAGIVENAPPIEWEQLNETIGWP